MQECTTFIGKTTMLKRGSINHYCVAIVKRTAGCTENQESWPWTNRQHAYLVSEVEISNVQWQTGARHYSSHHRAD